MQHAKGEIMTNVTYARQGTESNQILWVIEWAGAGWYAGANEVTYKLEAKSSQLAEMEARSKGLGSASYHETEASLIAAHGNNW